MCENDEKLKSICRPIFDSLCGDFKVQGYEQCDDGNYENGDGCNMFCVIERDIMYGNESYQI